MSQLFSKTKAFVRERGYASLIRYAMKFVLWKIFGRFLILVAIRKLRNLAAKADSIESAIRVASEFSFVGMSIAPSQIEREITELLGLVKGIEPRAILEIGTANGGTLFLFTRMASEDAKVISVDLPKGNFGGGYPVWKSGLFKSFAKNCQAVCLIRADSHKTETLHEVRKILDKRSIDFLFIDGDHTYEGVRKDFEMYSPLVRNGGIIAFHDICPGPSENVGGVPDFWKEISAKYQSRSILKDSTQGGYGIGVLLL